MELQKTMNSNVYLVEKIQQRKDIIVKVLRRFLLSYISEKLIFRLNLFAKSSEDCGYVSGEDPTAAIDRVLSMYQELAKRGTIILMRTVFPTRPNYEIHYG